MIRPRVIAYTLLALVLAWLAWPREALAPDPAIKNGYRAALAAYANRRRAELALDSLALARRTTDRVLQRAAATIRDLQIIALDAPTLGAVRVDSEPRLVVGPHTPTDTLVALPLARAKVAEVIDSARVLLMGLEAVVLIERARADSVIAAFQRTLAAQDSVIVGLRSELRSARKPWPVRAVRGVEHAAAGIACGGAGYLLGGPAGGLGGFVVCAAVAGVRR